MGVSVKKWLLRMGEEGLSPDLVAFNAIIDSFARRGLLADAERWLKELKDAGLQPNVRSYTPFSAALAQRGDVVATARWLRTMIEDSVSPNAVSHATLVDAHVSQGNATEASATLERLLEAGADADARTISAVLRCCTRAAYPSQRVLLTNVGISRGGADKMPAKLDCFGRQHQQLMGDLSRRDQIRDFAKDMKEPYERRAVSRQGTRGLKESQSLPGLHCGTKPMRRFWVSGPLPENSNRTHSRQPARATTAPGRVRSKQRLKSLTLPEVPGAESTEAAEVVDLPQRPQTTDNPGHHQPRPQQSAKMAWIARANHVPLDTCLALSKTGRFLEQVAALEKNLNIDQFGKCLLHCTGMDSLDELPQNLLRHAFAVADKDKNGSISFPEFVTWFSTVGFNTNVTLSAKERSFREFCAENALSLVDMDRYKKYFAEYDMDESGEIDQEEFEALIRRCARVPRHLEIPATRMKQFWAQADCDQSGSIDFEEFALFYRKFFEADGVGGFESFYRNVRPPLGEHEKALHWFELLQASGGHISGADLSAAVQSAAASGEPQEAASWMQEAQAKGLSVKVRAFAAVAKAYAAKGRLILAARTLTQMRQAGHRVTASTWATLLAALATGPKRPGEAELLLRQMAGIDVDIPGRFAFGCLQRALGARRLRLLRQALFVGVGPSPAVEEDMGNACWDSLQKLWQGHLDGGWTVFSSHDEDVVAVAAAGCFETSASFDMHKGLAKGRR
eukprot:s1208_g6.t4